MLQSSSNRSISTSTVQRSLSESRLHSQIVAKKPLLKDTNKKRLAWAKKHKQWTLDRWKSVLLSDQICDFWSNPQCQCDTQSRWTDDLCMCGFHCEAWRQRCDGVGVLWWCRGALLVTLSVIYLEFKAHVTSMATTAFCSDTPPRLVCA
jgi:hypothetical protein